MGPESEHLLKRPSVPQSPYPSSSPGKGFGFNSKGVRKLLEGLQQKSGMMNLTVYQEHSGYCVEGKDRIKETNC